VLLNFSCFILGAQAPGAEIKPDCVAVDMESHGMHVRLPVAAGMSLGMAHVMTELWRFTT